MKKSIVVCIVTVAIAVTAIFGISYFLKAKKEAETDYTVYFTLADSSNFDHSDLGNIGEPLSDNEESKLIDAFCTYMTNSLNNPPAFDKARMYTSVSIYKDETWVTLHYNGNLDGDTLIGDAVMQYLGNGEYLIYKVWDSHNYTLYNYLEE